MVELQGLFKKDWDWFAVSSTEWWMEVRLVGLIEGSSTTQAYFSSVDCEHALRQEVDFFDVLFCGVVVPAWSAPSSKATLWTFALNSGNLCRRYLNSLNRLMGMMP